MKTITILGSTGSIGTQTIDVCTQRGFAVSGLAANQNVRLLEQQTRLLKPHLICIFDDTLYKQMKTAVADCNVRVVTGMDGLCEVAAEPHADTMLNAVVGMIGLQPTIAAIRARKTIALANKETLVTGGKLVYDELQKTGGTLLPVDSEHSAIFQCLQGNKREQVHKIILTASGGPFFGMTAAQLAGKTARDALKHPNWNMGAKITVDCATLMNKGLELIEAAWLFSRKPEEISIVVHPQSVIHSMVEYQDHAVIAQLGTPDMRLPIQYALTYPDRLPCEVPPLSFTDYSKLTFAAPDMDTFVCLKACIEAFSKGGLYPTMVNGANEQAVALFLQGRISFLDIGRLVYDSIGCAPNRESFTVADIIETDRIARAFVLSKMV